MYSSGIELPKVQFSLIDYAYIETGSYFTGFDLDNSGKLSKMDNSGIITVIEGESSARYVGEEYGGGVVFHVYKDALGVEHGLIVSIINQSSSSTYSNIDDISIGASTTWNGETNTNLMSTQVGATSGAWKDCNDYTYGSFSDWYLPAVDELSLLWQNRYNTNKTLASIGGATQIGNVNCWSSTEILGPDAYYFTFINGFAGTNNKAGIFTVRAIRQF